MNDVKKCTKCGLIKLVSEFNKDRHGKNGIHAQCIVCCKKYRKENRAELLKRQKEYYQKNKKRILKRSKEYRDTRETKTYKRKRALKHYYGITLEQYDVMFERQAGVCAICGGINENGCRLCVDHDHNTGEIRDLLCHRCNLLIGNVKENVAMLQSAISYINKYKRTSEPGV